MIIYYPCGVLLLEIASILGKKMGQMVNKVSMVASYSFSPDLYFCCYVCQEATFSLWMVQLVYYVVLIYTSAAPPLSGSSLLSVDGIN